ncbi:cell adhesion domain-containing protein [Peribacillus muralis]|uniref:cell adhesion domain-containing protein n=1 Tax=Peribacillus muralis TaxID=264697 RepID=UPI000A786008|nr:cell adhesion domain-containing protein [Peribacillus muralis]
MKKVHHILISLVLLFVIAPWYPTSTAAAYDGQTLDTGIYWFGSGNVSQKFIAGQSNSYFGASKPTLIYIHGWQKDTTASLFRETFNPKRNDATNGPDVNTVNYWVSKGWNVGIFYWNQLADEGEVKDAEAKIWTSSGPQGMRWRKKDGTYSTAGAPTVSAAQLFVNTYKQAMQGFTGSEVRFAGHSLGNQLVTNSAKLISDQVDGGTIATNLRPKRVALLDPFWSKDAKSYLGNKWTGELCRQYVTHLKTKGVAFEQYKSSAITDVGIGDSNNGMIQLTAFAELKPWYISATDQGGKHGAARDWYFYSMGFGAPAEIQNGAATGLTGASAATATTRIQTMMNSSNRWYQDAGQNSADPSDDKFEVISR